MSKQPFYSDGRDGRESVSQGMPCPHCRTYVYYTIGQAKLGEDLICTECGTTYIVSTTNTGGMSISAPLGESDGITVFLKKKES